MLDHMTVKVRDMEKTRHFYERTLAPLGYSLAFDQTFGTTRVVGFGCGGKIDTWFTTDTPVSGPTHFAWVAADRDQVDAFYRAALEAGGKDNGPPGPRPLYHPHYYGAFVLDPDGNNVEAVCRAPA